MSGTKQRDLSADLVKCIGCIFVILLHVQTPLDYQRGVLTTVHLVVSCLVADGVMVFFAATGFFVFREKDFFKRWKRSAVSVFLPGVIALVFYLFTHRWMEGTANLLQSITAVSVDEVKQLIFHLLRWSVPAYAGHLWYLEEYLKCLLLYPLLLFICVDDRRAVIVRRGIILLGFLALLFTDLGRLDLSPFKHIAPFKPITTPAMMMLIGYELYTMKEKRRQGFSLPGFLLGLALYILPNAVRAIMQYKMQSVIPGDSYLLSWETAAGVLAASGIILAVFSCRNTNRFVSAAVRALAPCTYGIYLIHVCVVNRMDCFHLRDRVIDFFHAMESPAGYLATIFTAGLAALLISFALIFLWHLAKTKAGSRLTKA